MSIERYVISSFIPNSPTDMEFLVALTQFCNHKQADLQLYSTKENYKKDLQSYDFMEQLEALDTFIVRPTNLNNNVKVTDLALNINIIDPLSGLDSIAAQEGCLIVPFPRQRFKSVPRMLKDGHLPRAMWCTGSVSEPYYKPTKSGRRMESYHLKGALYVQIENDEIFHVHQLQWDGKGFYHFLHYYTPEEVIYDPYAVSAISMADDHAIFHNPHSISALESLIKNLTPDKHNLQLFRHDTLDCGSISHHTMGKHLTRAKINMTLEQELKTTSDFIQRFCIKFPYITQHMVPSNHPEHLDRYIDEARYKDESQNHILGAELAYASAIGNNLYEYSMKKYNTLPNVIFYTRKDSLKVHGFEMLCHGDEGSNGSRGNSKDNGIVYNGKVISGHQHSTEIGIYGNPVNGTHTHLNLPYTKDSGGSGWMNTDTILYKNGTFTQNHYIPKAKKCLTK